jgi:hypothetical protein
MTVASQLSDATVLHATSNEGKLPAELMKTTSGF